LTPHTNSSRRAAATINSLRGESDDSVDYIYRNVADRFIRSRRDILQGGQGRDGIAPQLSDDEFNRASDHIAWVIVGHQTHAATCLSV
jgi:hypothetical protein